MSRKDVACIFMLNIFLAHSDRFLFRERIPIQNIYFLPVQNLESPLGDCQALRPGRDVVGVLLSQLSHLVEGKGRDVHKVLCHQGNRGQRQRGKEKEKKQVV